MLACDHIYELETCQLVQCLAAGTGLDEEGVQAGEHCAFSKKGQCGARNGVANQKELGNRT